MGLATPARCLSNSGLQRCSIATLNGLLVAYPDKLPQELTLPLADRSAARAGKNEISAKRVALGQTPRDSSG